MGAAGAGVVDASCARRGVRVAAVDEQRPGAADAPAGHFHRRGAERIAREDGADGAAGRKQEDGDIQAVGIFDAARRSAEGDAVDGQQFAQGRQVDGHALSSPA